MQLALDPPLTSHDEGPGGNPLRGNPPGQEGDVGPRAGPPRQARDPRAHATHLTDPT